MTQTNAFAGLPDISTIDENYLTDLTLDNMTAETMYQVELKAWLQEWVERSDNVMRIANYLDRPYTQMVRQVRSSHPSLTGEFAYNTDAWVRDQLMLLSVAGLPLAVDGIELPRPPDFDLNTMEFIETPPEFLDDNTYSSQAARDRKAAQDAAEAKAAKERAAREAAEREAAEREAAAQAEAARETAEREAAARLAEEQAAAERAAAEKMTPAQRAVEQAREALREAEQNADAEAAAQQTQPAGQEPSTAAPEDVAPAAPPGPAPTLPNVASPAVPRSAQPSAAQPSAAEHAAPASTAPDPTEPATHTPAPAAREPAAPHAATQNLPTRESATRDAAAPESQSQKGSTQDADAGADSGDVSQAGTGGGLRAIQDELSADRGSPDSPDPAAAQAAKGGADASSEEPAKQVPVRRFQGFRVIKVGESEVMRCLGCGTNWSCRNCETPDGVTDIKEPTMEPVMRYAGVSKDEKVVPPGASVHNWRPTSVYSSPWQDPDWFDDELAAEDVRVLFGALLGELMESGSASATERQSILELALREEDPRDVLFYNQKTATLIRDWQRLEIAYASTFLVGEIERIDIASPLALALRKNLLMCEAILIGTHKLTMPGHEIPWTTFQFKEALETRIEEIKSLDERLEPHRQKASETKEGLPIIRNITPMLANVPFLSRFATEPPPPPESVSELDENLAEITEAAEREKAEKEAIEKAPETLNRRAQKASRATPTARETRRSKTTILPNIPPRA